jgi:hypothetical protein
MAYVWRPGSLSGGEDIEHSHHGGVRKGGPCICNENLSITHLNLTYTTLLTSETGASS